jgi:hypothetical protein
MPSFPEVRKETFYRVVLSEQRFARPVAIREDGKPDRTILAVCRRTVADRQEHVTDTSMEMLAVTVGRDETHEKGGIAEARRGLKLVRDGETDAYAFEGTVLEETEYSLVLQFARPKLTTLGRR